jgi:hypothetical protein
MKHIRDTLLMELKEPLWMISTTNMTTQLKSKMWNYLRVPPHNQVRENIKL